MARRLVTFCGETFFLRQPGHYAMQDLLEMAEGDIDTESAAGFRAITALIQAAMSSEDYARWERLARRENSTGEEMISLVMGGLAERPTSLPSDSSAGHTGTATSSAGDSSSPAIARLSTRPDLQLLVQQAQEARSA